MAADRADFSDLFKQTGPCEWSPDGTMLAVAVMHRCVIRDPSTMEILEIFTCNDAISRIEWSCDSKLVLCAVLRRSLVQIWNIDDPSWQCRVTEGVAGLAHARWAPDGRHVLTEAAFNLHLTVWSLGSDGAVYVKGPKSLRRCVCFSPDERFMAVAVRTQCQDFVEVYTTAGGGGERVPGAGVTIDGCEDDDASRDAVPGWGLVRRFPVPTHDLSRLEWSPDGRHILALDSPLQYLAVVLSPTGRHVAAFWFSFLFFLVSFPLSSFRGRKVASLYRSHSRRF
jgi:WD40 repeat protein